MADTTRRAVDQDSLTGPDLGNVHQALPGGEARQGQRGRVHVIQRTRLAGQLPRRRGDQFSVGTRRPREHRHAVDLVARLKSIHARDHVFHHARDIPTEDEGRLAEHRAGATPDARFDRIESDRADSNQYFGGNGLGRVDLDDLEHIGVAETVLCYGSHVNVSADG
jgi:hypothetical protein